MAPDPPTNEAESPDDSQLDHTQQSSTSTTLECSTLESLPSEVLVDIIRSCGPDNMASVTQTLCFVSKRIEPVARRELYRRISIVPYKKLSILCRTLRDNPQLGQYILELELLVPSRELGRTSTLYKSIEVDFQLLWSMYFEVLERSTSLRQLTMALPDNGQNDLPTETVYDRFITRLSEAITRSQQGGSAKAILPRLERIKLTDEVYLTTSRRRLAGTVKPEVFKPFLRLPTLSNLEATNDSGHWGFGKSPIQRAAGSSTTVVNALHHEHIKSVILRESDCNSTDVMDLVDMFPAMEILFIQNHQRTSIRNYRGNHRGNHRGEERPITSQTKADKPGKQYLSDSFEKLQKLKTLAYVTHDDGFGVPGSTGDRLGPSDFLSLKGLCNLTSISVLINVFASPDASTTGQLTVSPAEVLPRSLRSLHIIVDHNTGRKVMDVTPLNDALFQPRVAALGFMEDLISFCPTEFPSLRQVEYIWAVSRVVPDLPAEQVWVTMRGPPSWLNRRIRTTRRRCDGSLPLCCDMHTRMQALSPEMDYTSKAEGVVSPFRARFDSLELAFGLVGVTFNITELEDYSLLFYHWQQGRE